MNKIWRILLATMMALGLMLSTNIALTSAHGCHAVTTRNVGDGNWGVVNTHITASGINSISGNYYSPVNHIESVGTLPRTFISLYPAPGELGKAEFGVVMSPDTGRPHRWLVNLDNGNGGDLEFFASGVISGSSHDLKITTAVNLGVRSFNFYLDNQLVANWAEWPMFTPTRGFVSAQQASTGKSQFFGAQSSKFHWSTLLYSVGSTNYAWPANSPISYSDDEIDDYGKISRALYNVYFWDNYC